MRMTGNRAPPIPAASIRSTAAIRGEAKISESAANIPGGREHGAHLVGHLPAQQADRQRAKPPAQGDQGRLGTQHEPEADRREAREDDPRQVHRASGRGLEAVGGHVTPAARQAHDGKRRHHAGDREHRQRPPQRRAVVTEVAGEALEHPHLNLVHELEEAPGDKRHDQPHDRRQREQPDELSAAQDGGRVRRGCGGGLVHGKAQGRRPGGGAVHPIWMMRHPTGRSILAMCLATASTVTCAARPAMSCDLRRQHDGRPRAHPVRDDVPVPLPVRPADARARAARGDHADDLVSHRERLLATGSRASSARCS